jgi:hypothetical protein
MVEGQASDLYASDTDTWTPSTPLYKLGCTSPMHSHANFASKPNYSRHTNSTTVTAARRRRHLYSEALTSN